MLIRKIQLTYYLLSFNRIFEVDIISIFLWYLLFNTFLAFISVSLNLFDSINGNIILHGGYDK